VAESIRPPVAIRIVRPYGSEDELLEHELETVGKSSVILIGAHPRPTGVVLRFEVTLASGATVLRGEGRVLAHKENAFRGQPGLTLRFTRLDPRSKAVVDRATAMREARQQEGGSPSRPPPPRAEGAIAEALTASTPAPGATAATHESRPPGSVNTDQEAAVASALASAREKANATARANAKRTASGMGPALTPPPLPVDGARPRSSAPPRGGPRSAPPAASAPPPPVAPVSAGAAPALSAPPPRPLAASLAPIAPPPDRAELLARLRERAEKLPPERVQEILATGR
jgi:hypothetical protein